MKKATTAAQGFMCDGGKRRQRFKKIFMYDHGKMRLKRKKKNTAPRIIVYLRRYSDDGNR